MEKSALAMGSEPGFTACPVQGQRQDGKDRPAAHRLYQRAQELGPEGVDAAQQQAGGQAVRRRGEQAGRIGICLFNRKKVTKVGRTYD